MKKIKLFFNRLILRLRGLKADDLHELLTVQNYLDKNPRSDFSFNEVLKNGKKYN